MFEFNVPTLKKSEDATKLKNTILTSEPNAKVEIDTNSQKVSIESEASAETFKQLITASGHKLS